MTGKREYIINYIESRRGSVTFGDLVKNKGIGTGMLNVDGMPKLTNVLHIKGMEANFISISLL